MRLFKPLAMRWSTNYRQLQLRLIGRTCQSPYRWATCDPCQGPKVRMHPNKYLLHFCMWLKFVFSDWGCFISGKMWLNTPKNLKSLKRLNDLVSAGDDARGPVSLACSGKWQLITEQVHGAFGARYRSLTTRPRDPRLSVERKTSFRCVTSSPIMPWGSSGLALTYIPVQEWWKEMCLLEGFSIVLHHSASD